MDEDRGKELLIAPPPEGDGMSHATSKYRYARRFRTAGERRTDMQEILFSAKRIDNGYTVCGYHVKDGVTGKHFIVAEGSMLHESDKVGEEGLLNFVAFEVDEDTISVTGDGWIQAEKQNHKKPQVHVNNEDVKIGAILFRKGTKAYRCPVCDRMLMYGDKFCRDCGQAISWEESEEE